MNLGLRRSVSQSLLDESDQCPNIHSDPIARMDRLSRNVGEPSWRGNLSRPRIH
jgi:hypothetical protein